MYFEEKDNVKLRFKEDVEFYFYDSRLRFIHSKLTIKKGVIIDPIHCSYGEYVPTYLYDRFYIVDIECSQFEEGEFELEIICPSVDDINDVEELKNELAYLEIDAEKVEEIKQRRIKL